MQSSLDLFAPPTPEPIAVGPDAWLLKGFAHAQADDLLAQIGKIEQQAAFRHQVTPGGHAMSSAQCSCGTYGWITDKHGYRYTTEDPLTDKPWPAMPSSFRELAVRAAAELAALGYCDALTDGQTPGFQAKHDALTAHVSERVSKGQFVARQQVTDGARPVAVLATGGTHGGGHRGGG